MAREQRAPLRARQECLDGIERDDGVAGFGLSLGLHHDRLDSLGEPSPDDDPGGDEGEDPEEDPHRDAAPQVQEDPAHGDGEGNRQR